MARISETELQRRLKALEKKSPPGGTSYVGNSSPTGTNYVNGDTHYDSVLNNLWLFNDGTWTLTSKQLHIYYADNVTNVNADGTVNSQNDVTGFSQTPFDSGGNQKAWRGLWWGPTDVASTDPTDYEWTLTSGEAGDTPSYTRYYTTYPGLLSELGDPDNTVSGVTWTLFTGTAPSTAYWVAEKFTVGTDVSPWAIYPVQAKEGGIPFVRATKAGYNKPTLGDSTWITDAVAAVSSFTGRSYSNQKEFGYGTVVVIEYDNGKLAGKYTRSGSSDTWVDPAEFIDGDLVVDGTIAAEKIQATSIDATKIVVTGTNAITYSTVGADPSGAAATAESNAASDATTKANTAESNAVSTAAADATTKANTAESNATSTAAADATSKANTAESNAISTASADATSKVAVVTNNIYTPNTTTIDGGVITTGSITADAIVANSITSSQISAEGVSADKIRLDGALEFTENSSGIHFGKGSLFDGSSGAFFGRSLAADGVTDLVGISITSPTSQLTMASNGDLNISGAKIFSGAPGTPTEISTSGTYNLPVGTTSIDLVITGGGGGGPTNAASDRPANTRISGTDGGDTIVKFYSGANGTGTLLNTYTASGGAGGAYSVISNTIDRVGTPGEASLAPGSTGGSAGNIPSSASGKSTGIGDGTRGGGGGSGGANGDNGSEDAASNNGGSAGQTLSFTYDASNASSYVVTIGAGGAGGVPAQLTQYIASGGDGGDGYVGVTNSIAGGTLIDFDDFFILPSNTDMTGLSSITSSSNGSSHSAPQGAGWYWVSGGVYGTQNTVWSQQGFVPWGVDIGNNGFPLTIRHYSNSSHTLYYKKLF